MNIENILILIGTALAVVILVLVCLIEVLKEKVHTREEQNGMLTLDIDKLKQDYYELFSELNVTLIKRNKNDNKIKLVKHKKSK